MATETITAVTINPAKDTTHLSKSIDLVELSVSTLEVRTDEDYVAAGQALNRIAAAEKQVEDFFGGDRDMAFRLHRSICDKINLFKRPLAKYRDAITLKMGNWKRQQILADQERQRKAEAVAAEIQRKADTEARNLIKRGFVQEAAQVVQAVSEMTAPTPMERPTPKLEGVRESMPWVGEVADPMALLKAIVEGKVPLMHNVAVKGVVQEVCLVEFNSTVINQMAKKMEKEFKWPGCAAKQELRFGGKRS